MALQVVHRYANRAKNIQNKPKINEDPKDAMLREFQDEIARLKAKLEGRPYHARKDGAGAGAGGYSPRSPAIEELVVERVAPP